MTGKNKGFIRTDETFAIIAGKLKELPEYFFTTWL
jgi:hypothetical protein